MECYALSLARAFAELGWDVGFFGRKADPELAREMGIRVRLSGGSGGRFRKLRDWRFFRDVRRIGPELPGMRIALSRAPSRDLIICGGTHRGYRRASGRFHGPFDWLQERIEVASYEAAGRVVSHSGLCSSELESLYSVPGEKIRTLYPPIERRFTPGSREESRNALGLPLDKAVLLFPSMGHKRKGLSLVCNALRPFASEVVLAVAGKPAGRSRFSFVRPLDYVRDMETAYRAADFTILASMYEPFGLAGPESVLCGTRLLFEENIGCLPALAPEAAIRFSARVPGSLRSAIQQALNMRRAGRHQITSPNSALMYNPDPIAHARDLISLWDGLPGSRSESEAKRGAAREGGGRPSFPDARRGE
jgi:glycosyltransferase involved in cell wall biosynthesis